MNTTTPDRMTVEPVYAYTKAQINALVASIVNSPPTVEPTVLQFRLETIRQLLTLPTSD